MSVLTPPRPIAPEEEERLSPLLADWAYLAGGPYEEWRFGGPDAARIVLASWVRRPTSEVASRRWSVLFRDGDPAGGFVALPAPELDKARRADLLALSRLGDLGAVRERLAAVIDLFEPVEPGDLYLARIAVAPAHRRHGVGSALLAAVLQTAADRRCDAVRLDVASSNRAAIALYRATGFRELAARSSEVAGLRYVGMVRPV